MRKTIAILIMIGLAILIISDAHASWLERNDGALVWITPTQTATATITPTATDKPKRHESQSGEPYPAPVQTRHAEETQFAVTAPWTPYPTRQPWTPTLAPTMTPGGEWPTVAPTATETARAGTLPPPYP